MGQKMDMFSPFRKQTSKRCTELGVGAEVMTHQNIHRMDIPTDVNLMTHSSDVVVKRKVELHCGEITLLAAAPQYHSSLAG